MNKLKFPVAPTEVVAGKDGAKKRRKSQQDLALTIER